MSAQYKAVVINPGFNGTGTRRLWWIQAWPEVELCDRNSCYSSWDGFSWSSCGWEATGSRILDSGLREVVPADTVVGACWPGRSLSGHLSSEEESVWTCLLHLTFVRGAFQWRVADEEIQSPDLWKQVVCPTPPPRCDTNLQNVYRVIKIFYKVLYVEEPKYFSV